MKSPPHRPAKGLKLQVDICVARGRMSAVRQHEPRRCRALIEIQTGANEACNQIRAEALGRPPGYEAAGTAGQISGATVGQWSAGPSFNQGVGGSIPARVDVSVSKTLDPELLPVAASTVYECNRIVSRFG